MDRRGLAGGLAGRGAVTLRAACAGPIGDGGHSGRVTSVAVSDWHAQLEPLSVTVDGAPRPVAGAAVLAAYFDRERRENPTTHELIAETVGRAVQEQGTVTARIEGRIGEGSGE